MLHCNMTTSLSLQQGLEGLLADMRRERRAADLGRLAFLAYCEVRRWAREAGDGEIAAQAAAVATGNAVFTSLTVAVAIGAVPFNGMINTWPTASVFASSKSLACTNKSRLTPNRSAIAPSMSPA